MLPSPEIKKMVAEILGEVDQAITPAEAPEGMTNPTFAPQATALAPQSPPDTGATIASPSNPEDSVEASGLPVASHEPSSSSPADLVQREKDTATQQSEPDPGAQPQKHRRSHGGALPRS
jgi:hypothetical protein